MLGRASTLILGREARAGAWWVEGSVTVGPVRNDSVRRDVRGGLRKERDTVSRRRNEEGFWCLAPCLLVRYLIWVPKRVCG